MPAFTHLHTHSHYSLLQALPKIPDLIKKAKSSGMDALALTDNGNLYGALEFYKAANAAGIKPIIGVDAYLAVRSRADKQSGIDNRHYRLVLLAENETGYQNLLKLVTAAHLEGFYYKPRLDRELLEKYHDGLIAISSAQNGEIVEALKSNHSTKAAAIADWYKKVFGDNNFFVELTFHQEIQGHNQLMRTTAEFAEKNKIKLVASHNIYYLEPADKKARDVLLSIQNGAPEEINNSANQKSEGSFYFLSMEEALKKFEDFPVALQNNQKIAERCKLTLTLGKWHFPNYETKNLTHDEELKRKVIEGLTRRRLVETTEVKERIAYELKIIRDKGYTPYFLVVADLLDYAHRNNILTTIRGSVAGSLVTYLAGITNVNPLEYKLPFERFLNPERPSPPDIDMDFADNRRDEVIEYARKKYGADKVAQIGTFGTMMARGGVRDVARALGFDYQTGDRIAKLIPFGSQGFPMSIDRALELVPELKTLYRNNPEVKTIIDMAKKIEGLARHISVHAAGVVISPTPLTDYTPLQFDPKGEGKIITQYDMHAIEDVGLVKFDFLGIRNLAILADSVERVRKTTGQTIDIESIPLNDQKTFNLLAKGETVGLFQLNGAGMTRYLKDLRPTTIHDINAMVALYRPGPMESIPRYIERKHNPRLITYLDPRLKEILSQSYGVITYQDDVLQIAIKLAGYSWLEADKLRKAMGKKIPAEMAAQKEKLIAGFVKNGMSKKKAEEMWALIEPFAAYGFNKAHAASYGRVAYQTAYMKANYPTIYMASVLTAEAGDVEKIGEIVAECGRMGIPILPPDINESFEDFTVIHLTNKTDKSTNNSPREKRPVSQSNAAAATDDSARREAIRFGLTSIKNFGAGIAHSIIEERQKNGKFKSLENFLERIKDRNLNKKSLESLIKTGALDSFGERGQMLANLDKLLEYRKEVSVIAAKQSSLFAGDMAEKLTAISLSPAAPATQIEKLAWEKELLGLYLSGHPLDQWRDKLKQREIDIAKIKNQYQEGMTVVLGGLIHEVRSVITKNNEPMAFVKMEDLTGVIEIVVFPSVYSEAKNFIKPEKCVAVKGRVSHRSGGVSLIAEQFKALT
jgi:DNA polymerase-3 subunit alpha